MFYKVLSVFCLLVCSINAKLPDYVTPCKIKDAKAFESCVLENTQRIIPHFKDGIKELSIPTLIPFHIAELVVDATKSLKLKVQNVDIINLEQFQFKDFKHDASKFHSKATFLFDKLILMGEYDVDGKILILPIKGHGPINITIVDFLLEYEFTIKGVPQDGVDYIHLKDQQCTYNAGRLYMKLDNLFNGDKVLGDQVNLFLNENWQDVNNEMRPAVTDVVVAVVESLLKSLITSMPMSEIVDLSD